MQGSSSTNGEPPTPTPIRHNYREANGIVDVLARERANMYIFNQLTILENLPSFVQRRLHADKEGTIFVRLKCHMASRPNCNSNCINFVNNAPMEQAPARAGAQPVLCNDAY